MKTIQQKTTLSQIILDLAKQHDGEITPEIVLNEAKSPESPLHKQFCWDDTKAAEMFRLAQAAALIRRIKVTYTTDKKEIRVRAFVNVRPQINDDETPEEQAKGIYVTLTRASSVESYREQMIKACRRDVEAFRTKYSAITEVSEIIFTMKKIFPED
jgi:hypothetical protein